MRIALVVHQFLPYRVGGTEVYTATLARELLAQGHAVEVFYPLDTVNVDRRVVHDGIPAYVAARAPLQERDNPVAAFWRTFRNRRVERAFVRFLDAFGPDLVHFQHLQNVSIRLIDLARGVPRVLTLHDYWYLCANGQLLRPDGSLCDGFGWDCVACAMARLSRSLPLAAQPLAYAALYYRSAVIHRALRMVDQMIAPSPFVRDLYIASGIPGERIVALHNGLSTERLAPHAQQLPAPPGRPLFGYLGSLAPSKGVHVLVEAFSRLSGQAGLVIYGDPTVFPDYVNQIRESAHHPDVRFGGPLATDRIGDALRQLDYLVVPSLWPETLGMVVDEAHAVGVPVIASNLGALTRIRDGISGRLFAPGDVSALADVLQDVTDKPSLRTVYTRHLPRVPTMPEHARKLCGLYRTLLDSDNGSGSAARS